jgi:hypothetical protein
MLNYSYYPFKNILEDIGAEDLVLLKDVSEGWYIDYKVQSLKIPDLAKQLSAFANQYGGWLIIGVNEASDGSRTASEFVGIPASELEKVSRNIREASSAHVNPEVLYEEKVISGPIESIGLAEDKAIIIIGIPMSENTPHIHSSGRIYRRLADQSKPKEETDRYILDDLWKRGSDRKIKLRNFLTTTPAIPSSQSDSSWAYIFLKPSHSQKGSSKKLSFKDFSEVLGAENVKTMNGVKMKFDGIYSTSDGFIARNIGTNDPSLATTSFRWWHDGTVRLDIPLNKYDLFAFLNNSEKYKNGDDYYRLANEMGYENIDIVDYSIFWVITASMMNVYLQILDLLGDKRDVYSCFTIKNLFHTIPFIDSKFFMERARKHFIPLTVDKDIVSPKEPSEENMFLHRYSDRNVNIKCADEYSALPFVFSLPVIYRVLQSVGIINSYDDIKGDTDIFGFHNINK